MAIRLDRLLYGIWVAAWHIVVYLREYTKVFSFFPSKHPLTLSICLSSRNISCLKISYATYVLNLSRSISKNSPIAVVNWTPRCLGKLTSHRVSQTVVWVHWVSDSLRFSYLFGYIVVVQ